MANSMHRHLNRGFSFKLGGDAAERSLEAPYPDHATEILPHA